MEIYLVGGAVRDALLGREVKDRDWVVVGADARAMLAAGYQPVGKDFPVFLHPETHEEYALARTERKTGRGYAGFTFHAEPDVTLEQDLQRRDLTINAMAQDAAGQVIDPFGGQADLAAGILRHVSPAFVEDPVRILRTARFAARYGFQVAPETLRLMADMVQSGEADVLVAERVWQEFARGLMEARPEVEALFGVPQRADYHPEIDCGIHTLLTLQSAADAGLSLPERYAALLHDLGKAATAPEILPAHHGHEEAGVPLVQAVNQRWKVPKACADLAVQVCRWHGQLHKAAELRPQTAAKILQQTDAYRRPERFAAMLNVCRADAQGRLGFEHAAYPQRKHWLALLAAAQQTDTAAIAAAHAEQPQRIAEAIAADRLARIKPLQEAYRQEQGKAT